MTKEEYFGIVDKEIERLKKQLDFYKVSAAESNSGDSEQNAFMAYIIDHTIKLLEPAKPLPKFLRIQNMSLDELNREKERINLNLEKNISLFREAQKEEEKKKSELKKYVDESAIWYYEWLCDREINWCNGRIFQIELLQSELKRDSGSFIRRILMDEASLDVLKDKYYHRMEKKEEYFSVSSSINSCLDFNKAKKVASLLEDIYKISSPFCISNYLISYIIFRYGSSYDYSHERIWDVDLFLKAIESFLLTFNKFADKNKDDFTDEKILPLIFHGNGTTLKERFNFYKLIPGITYLDSFILLKKTIEQREEFCKGPRKKDKKALYEFDNKIEMLMFELDQRILENLYLVWDFEEYVKDRIEKGLEPAISEGYSKHISHIRSEIIGLIESLKAKKAEIDAVKENYDEEIVKIADDITSIWVENKLFTKYGDYSNNLNLIAELLTYLHVDRVIDNIIEENQNLLLEEQMEALEKTNDISADDGIDINYYSNILKLTDGGYSLRLRTKM